MAARMSGFNSKCGGGARQLRCQGFDPFLHTLITSPSGANPHPPPPPTPGPTPRALISKQPSPSSHARPWDLPARVWRRRRPWLVGAHHPPAAYGDHRSRLASKAVRLLWHDRWNEHWRVGFRITSRLWTSMLTDQAYRDHARPAEDERRRVHWHLPLAFGPSLSKEETPGNDKRQYSRQVRLRGAGASGKGGCHRARSTGGCASERCSGWYL